MKIICFLISFSIVLITSATAVPENLKLLFVQILFRHGDRAPIQLYPTDPNLPTVWPEGLGKLTKLGRKQHYGLGKFLRDHYKNFTTSSPLEINVTSSEIDRCFKSAETNLASFYAPDDTWKFENDVDWQPISINYIPKKQDKYLETDSYCPNAEAEKKRVIESPEGKEFISKHKEMFDKLTDHSGEKITDWTSANYLHDVLYIEKKYNLTVPKWAEPYWKELSEVAASSFFWSFNSPLLHRLRAGPLLKLMIENMLQKIKGNIPELKFHMFSAHDTNVAVILDSLNLFNMKQPPYCATLLFELYGGPNLTSFIRLLYLNSTKPENIFQVPHVLILDGCSEYCPLEYFINYTQPLIPDDWEKECGIPKSSVETDDDSRRIISNVTLGLFCVIVVLLIVMVIMFMMYNRLYHKYLSYHPMRRN